MINIQIKIKRNEWPNAEKLVGAMPKKIKRAADKELMAVGETAVEDFQKKALSGGFGQRHGGPALVQTGTYVMSWKAERLAPLNVGVGPTGANRTMSNAALGELLEHGTFRMYGIPHMRGIMRWIERKGTKRIGKAITEAIGG